TLLLRRTETMVVTSRPLDSFLYGVDPYMGEGKKEIKAQGLEWKVRGGKGCKEKGRITSPFG
uniref:hypothetical protein n=1 Tax=Escherichia coli TaxID=562 RepID=UPI001A93B112